MNFGGNKICRGSPTVVPVQNVSNDVCILTGTMWTAARGNLQMVRTAELAFRAFVFTGGRVCEEHSLNGIGYYLLCSFEVRRRCIDFLARCELYTEI